MTSAYDYSELHELIDHLERDIVRVAELMCRYGGFHWVSRMLWWSLWRSG